MMNTKAASKAKNQLKPQHREAHQGPPCLILGVELLLQQWYKHTIYTIHYNVIRYLNLWIDDILGQPPLKAYHLAKYYP
jgi:hypothetical protein